MINSKKTDFFPLDRKRVFAHAPKKQRIKKWLLARGTALALFLLVFVAASVAKVQASSMIKGWLGGWSEDGNIGGVVGSGVPDGNETGVGWISMNNTNPEAAGSTPYSVTIDDAGKVSGYAWANASNTPNSSASQAENGLGWVDFNPQDHCTTGVPEANQYKAANCSPPSGSSGVFKSGNDFIGWARFVGIAKESALGNSGGWQGWLKMHNVAVDPATGELSGYAWNGEESGVGGNMANGLGWVDFSRATIEEVCTLAFDPEDKTLNENSSGSVVLSEVGTSCKCKNVKIESMNTSVADGVSATDVNFFADIKPDSANISFDTKSVESSTYFPDIIKAASDDCGEAFLDLSLLNVPDCTVSCAESIEVAPGGSEENIEISSSGTECGGLAVSSCDGSASNITIGGPTDGSCFASASSSATFRDSTTATVSTNIGGSCTTKVFVKRLGWIETNP